MTNDNNRNIQKCIRFNEDEYKNLIDLKKYYCESTLSETIRRAVADQLESLKKGEN